MPRRNCIVISLLACLTVALQGCQKQEDPASIAAPLVVAPTPRRECPGLTDEGYQPLYTARVFAQTNLGPGGDITPADVMALRCMTQEADAVELLRDLQRRGSLAGQMYALVGMRALDQAELERVLPKYATNEGTVLVAAGDIAAARRVSELARELRSTWYVQKLLPELYPPIAEPEGEVEWLDDAIPGNNEPASK